MSDQTIALLITVACFALMIAWVPFLDSVQRLLLRRKVAQEAVVFNEAEVPTLSEAGAD